MQDLWQGCTMLEKGASEGCYAWYAMKVDNMHIPTTILTKKPMAHKKCCVSYQLSLSSLMFSGRLVMERRSAPRRQTKNWSSPLRLSIGCMSPTAFRWYCMRLLASRWYVPAVFRYYCMTCGRLLSSYWRACCIVAPVRRVACRQYAPTAFLALVYDLVSSSGCSLERSWCCCFGASHVRPQHLEPSQMRVGRRQRKHMGSSDNYCIRGG